MNLAQINIGRIKAPMDSPIMGEFAMNLDRINALAEKSPGFVWRLKEESNNATSIKIFDDDFLIVNMSVWENTEALFKYVYQSDHKEYVKRRKEWFDALGEMHMALWYIEEGNIPTPHDGVERLNYLRKHGDTPYSFGFKKRFTEEDLYGFLKK